MKKFIAVIIAVAGIQFTDMATAGTAQLNLSCKSASGETTISGFARGEGFDLKIDINGKTLRYVDTCIDPSCSKTEKKGSLYVVEALNKGVFTIYFTDSPQDGGRIMGYFYALPETVKYTKTSRGYKARYKALYDGTDPSDNSPIKQFVKKPVLLSCSQDEEL